LSESGLKSIHPLTREDPDLDVILRMYGPLKPWFDKTWRSGKIERVE
jgi:hypothetical protein